jgi:outer membrane autotransporter protein
VKTEGSPNLQSFGLLARAAYTFHNGIGYLRPKIDANLVYLHADSYSETGAGNLDLRVASEDQTTFIFTPGFETGFRTNLDNGLVLRTYFSGGVSVQTSDEWQQSSRLANGPSEAGEFTTALPQDQMSVRVILGCQVQFTDNLSGYIQYEGELSKNVTHNGGGLGIKVEF